MNRLKTYFDQGIPFYAEILRSFSGATVFNALGLVHDSMHSISFENFSGERFFKPRQLETL